MAKGSQTHQKRLRENKVREKARLKREQRQQRRDGKKQGDRETEFLSAPGGEGIDFIVQPAGATEIAVETEDADARTQAQEVAEDR